MQVYIHVYAYVQLCLTAFRLPLIFSMVFFNRSWFFFSWSCGSTFRDRSSFKKNSWFSPKVRYAENSAVQIPKCLHNGHQNRKKVQFQICVRTHTHKNLDFPIWGKWGISSNCTFLARIIFWKLMSGIFCNIFSEFYSTLLWWYMQEMKPSNWART